MRLLRPSRRVLKNYVTHLFDLTNYCTNHMTKLILSLYALEMPTNSLGMIASCKENA